MSTSGISDVGGGSGDQLMGMMALLSNPTALQQKYAEFDARKKAADDAVALIGPAQDIARLRAEAQAAHEAAATALDQARASADKLVADAQAEVAQLKNDTRAKMDEATALIAKMKGDAAAKLAAAAQAHDDVQGVVQSQAQAAKELELREHAVSVRESNLKDAEAAHAARIKQWEEAASALQAQIAALK